MKISPQIYKVSRQLKENQKIALSFSGCGFLGAYHFGAAKSLQINGNKNFMPKVEKIAGASAGSLVASILVLSPEKIDASMNALCIMADEVHAQKFGALSPGYFINDTLQKMIDQLLPTDISEAQGKLHVSITDAKTWNNVLVNEFESRDHLISALLASCFIPFYSSGLRRIPPFLVNDTECIDGGLSNNLPIFHDIPTITCSPFSSIADICPDDESIWRVTFGKQIFMANSRNVLRGARALFPPKREILREYFENGYQDALRFLSRTTI